MVAKLDPENIDASLKLATFYMLGKKTAESREKVEAVLAKAPNNIEALFLMAGLYDLEKNLYEAASVFEKILELDANANPSLHGIGPGIRPSGQTR
jgi:cytochrome c-type biogenesis protein CcmH/NrfG